MPHDMLAAALAYAKRGWPVFPTRHDKTPFTQHGVGDATTNPDRIKTMWGQYPGANIALDVGGAGMMVLDLDPGHNLEELEKNVGSIPSTLLSARTPRGGQHLYFALDNAEIVSPSASKLAPHVDVRSFHSYVLLPPSKTKDGVYTWDGGSNGGNATPAFRSNEMLRLSNAGRDKHKDHDTWLIEADLPENVAKCATWLRGEATLPCAVAIDGQGGDQCAYNTAAMCKSYGISQAMASDLMWEHWNPRCVPPWGADEIDHFNQKIENGYRYNTSPPGHMTPAYKTAKSIALFSREELPDGGNEWINGRYRAVDRAGMEHIKLPTWLVDDFIPANSYTMLFGARGTFKTFIALDLALTIAAGFAVDTVWEAIETGPVCFVAGEGRSSLTKRVKAWEARHMSGATVDGFFLVDPVPGIVEAPEAFLDLLNAASPDGFKLTVLDTVGRSLQGVNENAQENASAFTALVEAIQRATGGAVLVIHHSGHDKVKRSRGSSVFGADVDTEVQVKATKYLASLSMPKQKDAAPWEKPKRLKLIEHKLTPDTHSLVVVEAGKEDIIRDDSEGLLDIVEEVAGQVLRSNTSKAYSQKELAIAIACDDRVTCGWSQVSQKYLTNIRENSDRAGSKWYYVPTSRWRIPNQSS